VVVTRTRITLHFYNDIVVSHVQETTRNTSLRLQAASGKVTGCETCGFKNSPNFVASDLFTTAVQFSFKMCDFVCVYFQTHRGLTPFHGFAKLDGVKTQITRCAIFKYFSFKSYTHSCLLYGICTLFFPSDQGACLLCCKAKQGHPRRILL
jgi:hypothetical protein